jgi:endonuclease/exonuclease/phosphatase (EEP) superfamily protein YafD
MRVATPKSGSAASSRAASDAFALTGIASSCVLCAALFLCYGLRPDAGAAVTLWPAWVWPAPGLLLAALGWRRSRRVVAAVALLWVAFVAVFAEEPRSLLRVRPWPAPGWEEARRRGEALRVVSLNCAGGSADAAAELEEYDPDLVLLQEAPRRDEVETLARRLFGEKAGVAWGLDTAILARGRVKAAPVSRPLRGTITQAHVALASGIAADVISLRLLPPTVRLDLWSPGCWREQAANRRTRVEQVRAVAREIDALPHLGPQIVGGDFNAPAGDRIYRLLPPRLRDTFREGGTGWGNTALNDVPISRIDQVWTSDHFRPLVVVARKTRDSDHRMVLCDLQVEARGH